MGKGTKNVIKAGFQWLAALLVAAVIMNIVLLFFNNTTGWIDRNTGATSAIYTPNSRMLTGTEGRGYQVTDSRGYVNGTDVLADNYILAFGSSFTQGREVNVGQRYTDLLNTRLGYTDTAYVYNVSQIHYFFPQMIQGFSALLQEFPDADKIILETWSTYFIPEELADALNQRAYDERETGENILSTLSLTKKLNIFIKEKAPLLSNISVTVNNIKELQSASSASEELDLAQYRVNLERIFEFITDEYDGEIILLFHPDLILNEDGTLVAKVDPTDACFKELCAEYHITLVDMTERFLQEYRENYTLPYGFSNTSYGKGHFNVEGHRMVADELLKVLRQEGQS